MTHKWRIGTKLQLSNLVLILTVLVVTSVSFHFLSQQFLIQDAKRQMKADADTIVQALQGLKGLSGESVTRQVAGVARLSAAGRLLQTKIVVFDRDNRIMYTNAAAEDTKLIRSLRRLDTSARNEGYLIERRPIRTASGETIGRILLATKIRDVSGLDRLLRGTQFFSTVIGGIVALAMGAMLGRHIARPIRQLAEGMRRFSPKKELPKIGVKTRDEVGELADSFIGMAEKLRAGDRKQTDFLQNVSHELKTPLMAIQGNAEAIRDGIVREREAEESLDIIVAECQRLKSVVDELIFLSRLDHDQAADVFRCEPARIGDIAEEALSGLRGLAEQRGVAIVVTGDMDTEGSFDREKLKRAFINIVGNGLRYARSEIAIRAVRSSDAVEVQCEDDGKGFAPGEEERIFDRFYKGEQGGTGIGLAVTKAIVEGHGGSIDAFQGPRGGAVIRLRLPLRKA